MYNTWNISAFFANMHTNQIFALAKLFNKAIHLIFSFYRCIELCLYRLSDHHKNVKDVFSSLLKAIPLNLTAR